MKEPSQLAKLLLGVLYDQEEDSFHERNKDCHKYVPKMVLELNRQKKALMK